MSALTLSSPSQDMGALLAQLQRSAQEGTQLEARCATYAGSKEQLGCAKVALCSSVERRRATFHITTSHCQLLDQERGRLDEAVQLRTQTLAMIDQTNARALGEIFDKKRGVYATGRSWASLCALCAPSQGGQQGDRLLVGRDRSYILIHRLFLKTSSYLSSLLHRPLSVEQCRELRLPERYATLPAIPIHVGKRPLKRLHLYYCGAPGARRFSGLSLEELVELYAAARFACDAGLERAVRERIEAKIVRAPQGHELLGSLYVASLQVDAAPLTRWVWQQMLSCLNIVNFYQLCPLLFRALSFHLTLETVQLFSQRLSHFDLFRGEAADHYMARQLEQVIDDPSLRELLYVRFCFYNTPVSFSGEETLGRLFDNLFAKAYRGESSVLEKMHLALAYERGYGVTADKERALYWYEKAAEEEASGGCLLLGGFFGRILGASLGLEEAEAPSLLSNLPFGEVRLKLLRNIKAAVDGDFASAHRVLAFYCRQYEQNPETAFSKAFGEVFGKPSRPSSAIRQAYARAIALGDTSAATELIHYCYANRAQEATLTQKCLDRRALKAYTKSAWEGEKWGLRNMCWCYLKGCGLPKDEGRAKLLAALFICAATPKEIEGLPDELKPAHYRSQAEQQGGGPGDDEKTAQNGGPP